MEKNSVSICKITQSLVTESDNVGMFLPILQTEVKSNYIFILTHTASTQKSQEPTPGPSMAPNCIFRQYCVPPGPNSMLWETEGMPYLLGLFRY